MATHTLVDQVHAADSANDHSWRRPESNQLDTNKSSQSRRGLLPAFVIRLQQFLRAGSRIEARIVVLQWSVMILVGVGALLPVPLGPGLDRLSITLVLSVLALHPIAYAAIASIGYPVLWLDRPARMALLTAIDVTIAVAVLFLTASKPGYTQVLLYSVVLLTATRYSLSRAIGITTLVAILQFFSIVASDHNGFPVTSLGSAVVAMFALTYGVNLLSRAERQEAATAAENARLYRGVLLRNRELATINSLSQTATQDTDPDRLLESGLELILSSMPITWGHVYTYDRQRDDIDLLFAKGEAWGPESGYSGMDLLNEARRAARTGSVVIAGNNAQDGESMARISAPIVVQGQSVAVFQALVPSVNEEADGQPPVLSLAVVCQELGNWVERALLRNAAQRGVVLEEKNRIARELHDTVLQILFSLGLGVDWCMHRVGDDTALGGKLQEMRKLTASASSELRSAIFTVTSRVAEVGLTPALQTLATDFLQQYSLPVSLSASGQQPEIAVLSQNALHRVVRESLMNVYKHAQATHISVRLIFEAESIAVVVQDDGIGLPEHIIQHLGDDPAHFGLRTIARQIEELGGTFEVLNGEESGAIVRASVPAKRLTKEAAHDNASAY